MPESALSRRSGDSGLSNQLHDFGLTSSGQRARHVAYTPMMSEKEYLCRSAKFSQQRERFRSAVVIKVDEEVIGDEGQRLGDGAVLLDVCEAEGEEQLVACPIAHPIDSNISSAGALADDNGCSVVVDISADTRKRAARRESE